MINKLEMLDNVFKGLKFKDAEYIEKTFADKSVLTKEDFKIFEEYLEMVNEDFYL